MSGGMLMTWLLLWLASIGVPAAVRPITRKPHHRDGARSVGQPADEAALLERRDQPVNAGLRAQVEGVLHLIERRRHAGFLQPLVDEAQQLELLAGQHWLVSSSVLNPPQVENKSDRKSTRLNSSNIP